MAARIGRSASLYRSDTSVFLATVSAEGQPYINHHGGPVGFLRALDAQTISFVDFAGAPEFIEPKCGGIGGLRWITPVCEYSP